MIKRIEKREDWFEGIVKWTLLIIHHEKGAILI